MMEPNDDQLSCHTVTSDRHIYGNSSSDTNSKLPRSSESFSVFSANACGEPLFVQQLKLDFTPDDSDTDFVQQKVCAFWDYLNSRKDVQHMMVVPVKESYSSHTTSDPSSKAGEQESVPESSVKEVTAVTMLEFVEKKGLIDRTFEAKLPQSMCSLGSTEYHENYLGSKLKSTPLRKEVCRCPGDCKSCRGWATPSAAVPESSPEVQLMCSRMQEWDKNHPKSMEPLGHPSALINCVMQRKFNT